MIPTMKRISFLLVILAIGCSSPKKQENPILKSGEGFVDVEGGKVWYGIMGEGDQTPILCLHGGPGGVGSSFIHLEYLTNDRPVILMHQLGSGLSTYHEDTSLLKVENFVAQVRAVKEGLNLNEFYLMGHSWGTALALEYYSVHPDGVRGIIFNSPYFSTSTWIEDTDALIATLPDSTQQIIAYAEENFEFETEEYLAAMQTFSDNFILRSNRDSIERPTYGIFNEAYDTVTVTGNRFIYNYMWGPSEFSPTGTLLNYENIDALKDVKVPVLFTTGEYDEARPGTTIGFARMVPDSKVVIIERAGHASLTDNKPIYVIAHSEFMNRIDERK